MTTLENANDGIPDDAPQEKLEWVTPKISLMATTETDKANRTAKRKRRTVVPLDPVCHKPRPHQQNSLAPTGLRRPFLMAWSIDYLAPLALI
jgi:hypothetical protein